MRRLATFLLMGMGVSDQATVETTEEPIWRVVVEVTPDWLHFSGVQLKEKTADGKFRMLLRYTNLLSPFNVHNGIGIEKHFDASDDRLPAILRLDGGPGDLSVFVSKLEAMEDRDRRALFEDAGLVMRAVVISGSFDQSFDNLSCYPADRETLTWTINLDTIFHPYLSLKIACPSDSECTEGDCRETAPVYWSSETLHAKCRRPSRGATYSFEWEDFECNQLQNRSASIQCTMAGNRDPRPVLLNKVGPSLFFLTMSFAGFFLEAKKAMPRVTTTVIGLLTMSNTRNAVTNELPTTKEPSWIEDYFFTAQLFLFFNLLGHVISFHIDRVYDTRVSRMLDFGYVGLGLGTFLIVAFVPLRECTSSAAPLSLSMIIIGANLDFVGIMLIIYEFKLRRKWRRDQHSDLSEQTTYPESESAQSIGKQKRGQPLVSQDFDSRRTETTPGDYPSSLGPQMFGNPQWVSSSAQESVEEEKKEEVAM